MAAELDEARQPTVYDAVRQLRPQWLTRTAGGRTGDEAVAAYVDDHFFGAVSTLTRIPTHTVVKVRYLSATEAQMRFGQQNELRAAIVVETVKP